MCRRQNHWGLDSRQTHEIKQHWKRIARSLDTKTFEEWTIAEPTGTYIKHGTLDESDIVRENRYRQRYHTPRANPRLGLISLLPLEVQHMILSQVSLHDLLRLPPAHPLSSALATLPHFAFLQRHFPQILHSIEAIRTCHAVTASRLHRTLTSPHCQDCHRFGPFVYLPTSRRLCFACLVSGEEYVPLSDHDAGTTFSMAAGDFAELPHLESVPAHYGTRRKALITPRRLVDYTAAFEMAKEKAGGLRELRLAMAGARRKRRHYNDVPVRHVYLEGCAGVKYGHEQVSPFDAERHVAVVNAGYYDIEDEKVHFGRACLACLDEDHRCDARFVERTFAKHIETYGPVENGRHVVPRSRWEQFLA